MCGPRELAWPPAWCLRAWTRRPMFPSRRRQLRRREPLRPRVAGRLGYRMQPRPESPVGSPWPCAHSRSPTRRATGRQSPTLRCGSKAASMADRVGFGWRHQRWRLRTPSNSEVRCRWLRRSPSPLPHRQRHSMSRALSPLHLQRPHRRPWMPSCPLRSASRRRSPWSDPRPKRRSPAHPRSRQNRPPSGMGLQRARRQRASGYANRAS